MSRKVYEKVNHRTGNLVRTTVTKSGNSTHTQRVLHKSDGVFGTRFLGTVKVLTDKTSTK